MSAPRDKRHLHVPAAPLAEPYTPHRHPFEESPEPWRPTDRRAHAKALRAELQRAAEEEDVRRAALDVVVHGAQKGLYIRVQSPHGAELALQSLEDRRFGIELRSVQSLPPDENGKSAQLAVVYVPDGALKGFFRKLEDYETKETLKGEPRNKELVDRIAEIRLATLRALWTDDPTVYPSEGEIIWWEVWLRREDKRELERFAEYAQVVGMSLGEHRLAFDDRLVILTRGTAEQLSASLDVLNDVAELRRAKETASFFAGLSAREQAAWGEDITERVVPPPANAPAVCILDTGVTRAHPLLQAAIDETAATAVDPAWGGHDNGGGPGDRGHGTEMAGLALYGDLVAPLVAPTPLQLRHRLESVKILPPNGANDPDLYGAITAQAVARPEINAPHRSRVFSLAVTTTDQRDRGRPTSWSAAIDALAAGRVFDISTKGLRYLDNDAEPERRLFVVSAGNVDPAGFTADYLDRSDLEVVHDPAQAWNALTVGGYTEKELIADDRWRTFRPIARSGELSPWSTNSVSFENKWPMKPEVVFEAGNVGHDGSLPDSAIPDLNLLTTYYRPQEKLFVETCGTSAATAQAARMAAIIRAEYPSYWPESVRGLIVHSARWTDVMERAINDADGKGKKAKLVQRYGFGVPTLERALRSASDALTLVVQATIHPFKEGRIHEMHLHELPWPTEELRELKDTLVRLRITLSYFIEPRPGSRGWKGRYTYASHGLRFDVKLPAENRDRFRKRLNQKALEEGERRPGGGSGSEEWLLGEQARHKGSLHCDIWEGTAAELADRNVIGVYPVTGWWKEQQNRDRSHLGARYALLAGIEVLDAEGVDIWTPIATEIGAPVETVPLEG